MIGLDTNVLVRTLVNDDPEQTKKVRALLADLSPARPAFIGTVVLVETYWVLNRAYRFDKSDILDALETMTRSAEVVFQDPALVTQAIRAARTGADFSDALIDADARLRGCSQVATFDQRAARHLNWRTL